MAVHYRSEGIVLKKIDRGEADQLLTIYTKDFGKVEILAKAMRKIKSKLRSESNLFNLSEIEFIQGKTYKTLTDASLIENFSEIRKDLKKLALSYRISEILDNLVRKEEKDESIWELLIETLKKLNTPFPQNLDSQLIFYYFTWNLLSFLGYKPELHICSLCQKELFPQNLYFNFQEGGVICQNCFKKIKNGKEISPETIKILRFIIEKEWRIISQLKIDEKYFLSLKRISDYWINFLPKATISDF